LKHIIFSAGLLVLGVFTITVHENQVEIINDQKAQISSYEEEMTSHEQYVSELKKNAHELNTKLSRASKRIDQLESENATLKERLSNFISLEATAYTPYCSTGCSGTTASGHFVGNTKTVEGMRVVATDPNVIPLGTIMKVHTNDQTFEAIALDTGGDIKGNRMDILYLRKDKARKFGRQEIHVEIVGHNPNYRTLDAM
jgi:3D (Asp-Asp-Asp) domain-containing protein